MAGEHILVAEDERHARLSLALILRQAEFRVTVAEDGQDALAKIEADPGTNGPVDLLLTDIQMPRMNGLELLDRLRQLGIELPVIGITGFGDKELVVELLRHGCNEYIDKPFTSEEVINRVVMVLKRERNLKTARAQQTGALERDVERIEFLLQGYNKRLQEMQRQLVLAAGAYHNLIDFSGQELNLPLALRNRPLATLGGDFVDIRRTAAGYDILIADVAGHDLGASYHTVLLKAFFDENCRTGNDGATFFKLLNRQLRENGKNERMVTALFLRLDLQAMEGHISSAGHPPLIQLRGAKTAPRLLPAIESVDHVLGLFETIECSTHRLRLTPGDLFLLFTDGIYEVARLDGSEGRRAKLGLEGLVTLASQERNGSLESTVARIWDGILGFCGNRPNDDMLLLGLEVPR